MAEAPLAYANVFTRIVHASAGAAPLGYGATKMSGGTFATATTSNLASSVTGTVDGVALAAGVVGQEQQYANGGFVDKAYVPGIGSGIVENAVCSSTGQIVRASAASGPIVGVCNKEGDLFINAVGLGGSAVSIGGTWSVPASAAYEAKRSVKASAGTLCVVVGFNAGPATYVQVFDSAAEPSGGAAPAFSFPVSQNRPLRTVRCCPGGAITTRPVAEAKASPSRAKATRPIRLIAS